MGLFDKLKKDRAAEVQSGKLMDDETAAKLKEQQDMANALIAANPGALPDMSDPEAMQASMADGMAYAQLAQHLNDHGVEAPAVIRSIRATDQTDLGGGRKIEFDVSIRPAVGEQYDSQISQHMRPAQMQGLSEGKSITVRYDPGAPQTALIVGW